MSQHLWTRIGRWLLLVIVTTSLYGLLEAPTGWRQLSCSEPFERVHPRLRGIPWKQSISIFTGARILRVKNYISDKVTGNSELIPLKLNTLQAPVKIVLLSCYLTCQFFCWGMLRKWLAEENWLRSPKNRCFGPTLLNSSVQCSVHTTHVLFVYTRRET